MQQKLRNGNITKFDGVVMCLLWGEYPDSNVYPPNSLDCKLKNFCMCGETEKIIKRTASSNKTQTWTEFGRLLPKPYVRGICMITGAAKLSSQKLSEWSNTAQKMRYWVLCEKFWIFPGCLFKIILEICIIF